MGKRIARTVRRAHRHDAQERLPGYFRPIFWWCAFAVLDPRKHRRDIIIHTINYGQWRHWEWLAHHYGAKEIKRVVKTVPVTAFRPRALKLLSLLLGITAFNYAPRGIAQKIRSHLPDIAHIS